MKISAWNADTKKCYLFFTRESRKIEESQPLWRSRDSLPHSTNNLEPNAVYGVYDGTAQKSVVIGVRKNHQVLSNQLLIALLTLNGEIQRQK